MSAATATTLDARAESAKRWAMRVAQVDEGHFMPASADASFRRYFRLRSHGTSWIVMDAPPAQENCGPFLHVADLMREAGLNVPTILGQDPEQGFLLMSDLGRDLYLKVLNQDNCGALFGDAIRALVAWQAASRPRKLPNYEPQLLRRELQLFDDWYVQRELGQQWSAAQRSLWEAHCGRLIQAAGAQFQVYVHRDYMPRNLMVCEQNPGVLDFQDAVIGPYAYDLLSLFKDAFISWPQAQVDGWIAEYGREARAAGLAIPADDAQLRIDVDWIGVQRHLKVLGIFARLKHRDGKAQYLEDAPRFLNYLHEVLPRYPQLRELQALIPAVDG